MGKVKIGWSSCEAVKRSGQVVALVQVKLQNWLQSLKLFDRRARKVIIIWRARTPFMNGLRKIMLFAF